MLELPLTGRERNFATREEHASKTPEMIDQPRYHQVLFGNWLCGKVFLTTQIFLAISGSGEMLRKVVARSSREALEAR